MDESDKLYRVKTTATARDAIREQVRHIVVEQRSPQNAAEWLDRIWSSVDGLEHLPFAYPQAEGYSHLPYVVRRVILDNHSILFTVDEANAIVYVVGLTHAARLARPRDLPVEPREDDAE